MTRPLFLFGTLRHRRLLDLVADAPLETCEATLQGHAVRAVVDQAFPILVAEPGAQVLGLAIRDIPAEAMARLDFYETIFDYQRTQVDVMIDGAQVSADVYVPPSGQWQAGAIWNLAQWERDHAEINLAAAREIMERKGQTPQSTLAALYPFIRARAASHVRAASKSMPTTLRRKTAPGDVTRHRDLPGFEGFFRLKHLELSVRGFDGAPGPVMERETFVAFDAALVLPYDPVRDLVLMVEQFRLAPYWRGEAEVFMLEPVAGLVDGDETPEAAARREAVEEAGLELLALELMGEGYPAPGYVTEYHHMFLGLCALETTMAGIGGLASESENIRSHIVPFETAMALVDTGEITATPLMLMLFWLARHRARLRAEHA
ncbi:gamma-glutamylcyclotransferase [Roseobacteraceae bacterium S113]